MIIVGAGWSCLSVFLAAQESFFSSLFSERCYDVLIQIQQNIFPNRIFPARPSQGYLVTRLSDHFKIKLLDCLFFFFFALHPPSHTSIVTQSQKSFWIIFHRFQPFSWYILQSAHWLFIFTFINFLRCKIVPPWCKRLWQQIGLTNKWRGWKISLHLLLTAADAARPLLLSGQSELVWN